MMPQHYTDPRAGMLAEPASTQVAPEGTPNYTLLDFLLGLLSHQDLGGGRDLISGVVPFVGGPGRGAGRAANSLLQRTPPRPPGTGVPSAYQVPTSRLDPRMQGVRQELLDLQARWATQGTRPMWRQYIDELADTGIDMARVYGFIGPPNNFAELLIGPMLNPFILHHIIENDLPTRSNLEREL